LAFFDVWDGHSGSLNIPDDIDLEVFPIAYEVGARIHSDSWGMGLNQYDTLTYAADSYHFLNQDFLAIFAAGNDGAQGNCE